MDRGSLELFLGQGLSLEQIGKKRVGKHPSTVGYWVQEHMLEAVNREKHAARGALARAELQGSVGEGLSIAEIALKLDRSKSTIRHWLRRHGLETHDAAGRPHGAREARQAGLAIVQLTCRRHGDTDFKIRADGNGYRCLKCRAEAVTRRRRRMKQVLVDEAGGRCQICGYARCRGALHFHHLDPSLKRFSLSHDGSALALDRLRAEAEKCILLCSNCHAEVENGVASVPREK